MLRQPPVLEIQGSEPEAPRRCLWTGETLEAGKDSVLHGAGSVDSLIRKDREAYEAEYERWVNEPISFYYTIRMMPTIYLSYDLPSEVTSEKEAIAYVSTIAKNQKCMAWLYLSRREKVFIDSSGEVIERDEHGFHDTILTYLPF